MNAGDFTLVLASSSPRRRALLQSAGVPFRVQPSGVEEKPHRGESAEDYTRRAARMKAESVSGRVAPGTWILAADTTVVVDGSILGKPENVLAAERMLRTLSGRSHRVLTAVVLLNAGDREPLELLSETTVWFRPLDMDTIHRYIATGEPLDKAGAYGIQGKGAVLVSSIEGSYTNVVGLPLAETMQLMEEAGVWRPFLEPGRPGIEEPAATGGAR